MASGNAGYGLSFRPAFSSAASSSPPACSATRSPPSARSFESCNAASTNVKMNSAADPAASPVLFLTHSFPRHPGDAAGSFILRLARALGDQGIRVAVVAPHAPGLAGHEVISGIEIVRFRYAPATLETLAYTGTMAEQVRSSWTARAT